MTGAEKAKLRTSLLKVTEEGPITEWIQRIANLAKAAGFNRLAYVNWNSSPMNVAFNLIEYMETVSQTELLIVAVEDAERRL